MKIAVFSARRYDREFMDAANVKLQAGHQLTYFEASLQLDTAPLAAGHEAICIFVNDTADAEVLSAVAAGGTRLVALRCTGFNNIDLVAVKKHQLTLVRVVNYSPYSVAEHALALLQSINRKIHRAYNRTRESNFSLDGLIGFDLHGKTVAIIGTGKIGCVFARIMHGFGCKVIGCDTRHSPDFEAIGGSYVEADEIGARADIISLHCPLTPQTYHIVNAQMLAQLKQGVILINTSRGGLIDTAAAIEALKTGKLGGLGLDVYEQEADLFYRDLSSTVVSDDIFERLLSFPNVIVTGHQAFFTHEAITTICETTIQSVTDFANGNTLANEIQIPDRV